MKGIFLALIFVIAMAVASPAVACSSYQACRAEAQQGDADAQTRLGFMYADGIGVRQNDSEAVRWYRMAAEQGNATAQTNLGGMYRNGRGVPQNYRQAVRWYRMAAEQGNATAQAFLGGMYASGLGVPRNLIRGYIWVSLSAAQGQPLSRDQRDRIANLLTPQQLQQAQALATRCFESGYKDCD